MGSSRGTGCSSSSMAAAIATSLSFATGVVAASLWFRCLRQQRDKEEEESDKNDSRIYLDYNGTTPAYPHVIQAMMPYLTKHYGNPSSSHWAGQEPRKAVDRARQQILELLGQQQPNDSSAPKESIWFTACGTESDNLAIHLALQSSRAKIKKLSAAGQKPRIVTCNVEHPAIEGCLNVLEEEQGLVDVMYVPVQSDGRVRAQDMIDAIQKDRERTILVTLMLANNETGALQPVQEVSQYCRKHGILFHTDAAQAAGKVSVQVCNSNSSSSSSSSSDSVMEEGGCGCADMISLVGHKIGAPKGVACLYVRPGCLEEHGRRLSHNHGVLLIGGGQEFGRRGGTENVPHIVAMGAAAESTAGEYKENAVRMERLRTRLLQQIRMELGCDKDDDSLVRPNGPIDPQHRLPNTLSVGIQNVHSGDLLGAVSHQVAASAGATCHGAAGVSSVLRAMKVPMEFARGTLRLSLGPTTTVAQIDRAASILADAAKQQLQQQKESLSS